MGRFSYFPNTLERAGRAIWELGTTKLCSISFGFQSHGCQAFLKLGKVPKTNLLKKYKQIQNCDTSGWRRQMFEQLPGICLWSRHCRKAWGPSSWFRKRKGAQRYLLFWFMWFLSSALRIYHLLLILVDVRHFPGSPIFWWRACVGSAVLGGPCIAPGAAPSYCWLWGWLTVSWLPFEKLMARKTSTLTFLP